MYVHTCVCSPVSMLRHTSICLLCQIVRDTATHKLGGSECVCVCVSKVQVSVCVCVSKVQVCVCVCE